VYVEEKMTLDQTTYPGVEFKKHLGATADSTISGCRDRLAEYPTDRELAQDILDIYTTMKDRRRMSAPSGEWEWIFRRRHGRFQAVLEDQDLDGLVSLLRGLFRNDLSFGLVSHSVYDDLVSGAESRQLDFANAIMLDIDTWLEFCDSPPLAELEIPDVGNPFGIEVDGALVVPDACRHAYHTRRLRSLMDHIQRRPTVLEVGGGYGGVFWRLWRDRKAPEGFCYVNCDLEETLFVFHYFVSTAVANGGPDVSRPRVKWALDERITAEDTAEYDLILVPASNRDSIDCGFDIAYNANSFSEMAREDLHDYFGIIDRNAPRFIFHQNSNFIPWKESSRGHMETLARDFPIDEEMYEKHYMAVSPWTGANGRYREYLYAHRDVWRGRRSD
jgi:hypothetical protein